MAIAKDVILIWPSTNATIPANYSRETDLDGRFPKGATAGNGGGVIGGANTHTHTSPSHSHSMGEHAHTFGFTSAAQGSPLVRTKSNASAAEVFNGSHTHNTATTGAVVGGTVTDSLVYGAVSNNPPYYDVIYIKSAGSRGVPPSTISLYASSSPPTGFSFCDGTGGTPDLRNRYLRGAPSGQNADVTVGGGSTTNIHDISHSHTATNHTHTGATSSGLVGANAAGQGGGLVVQAVHSNHVHTITFDNTSTAPATYSGTLTTTETVEPAHRKLSTIQNTTAADIDPLEIIGLWKGSLATIPSGWLLCDGTNGTPDMRDRFMKVVNTAGEIGNTGGSHTHTHATQSHSHGAGAGHTHTGTVSSHVAGQNDNNDSPAFESTDFRYIGSHSITSMASVGATYTSAETTGNLANNEPNYLTVLYIIRKNAPISFGGML